MQKAVGQQAWDLPTVGAVLVAEEFDHAPLLLKRKEDHEGGQQEVVEHGQQVRFAQQLPLAASQPLYMGCRQMVKAPVKTNSLGESRNPKN